MVPFLLTLPQELQCEIASFLGRDDLCALRFSCGMLLAPATQSLFAFIRLYPTYKSIERYNKIISHPEFKKHVRYVEFNTLEKGEKENMYTPTKCSLDLRAAIRGLMRIPNLTSVTLSFSSHASSGRYFGSVWPQIPKYRQPLLELLFNTLAHPALSSRLKEICINNIQNLNDKAFMQSPQVQCVLRKVKALRLYIISEHNDESAEDDIEMKELHGFMRELHPLWLSPASNNLTTLTLYQDLPFGFCPKLDLRGVHLPALRTLALGNYSFSHTWQLDFLSAHASTLENLYLDRCTVIYYANLLCPFDDDGYPNLERFEPQQNRFFADTMTWSRIFSQLRENLRNLRRFRFGNSPRWEEPVKGIALWDENNTHFDALAYETMEQNVDTAYQMLDMYGEQPYFHSDWVSREGISPMQLHLEVMFSMDNRVHSEEVKKSTFFLTHMKEQNREDVSAFEELLESIKDR